MAGFPHSGNPLSYFSNQNATEEIGRRGEATAADDSVTYFEDDNSRCAWESSVSNAQASSNACASETSVPPPSSSAAPLNGLFVDPVWGLCPFEGKVRAPDSVWGQNRSFEGRVRAPPSLLNGSTAIVGGCGEKKIAMDLPDNDDEDYMKIGPMYYIKIDRNYLKTPYGFTLTRYYHLKDDEGNMIIGKNGKVSVSPFSNYPL
jgi:hypothetical protein